MRFVQLILRANVSQICLGITPAFLLILCLIGRYAAAVVMLVIVFDTIAFKAPH
jgi:hypothetical protein